MVQPLRNPARGRQSPPEAAGGRRRGDLSGRTIKAPVRPSEAVTGLYLRSTGKSLPTNVQCSIVTGNPDTMPLPDARETIPGDFPGKRDYGVTGDEPIGGFNRPEGENVFCPRGGFIMVKPDNILFFSPILNPDADRHTITPDFNKSSISFSSSLYAREHSI